MARVDDLRRLLAGAEVSAEKPARQDGLYEEVHIYAPPVVIRVPYAAGGREAAERRVWELAEAVEESLKGQARRRDEAPVYVRGPVAERSRG